MNKVKEKNQPAQDSIRFLHGRIEGVEYKFDGIWMKPIKELELKGQILLTFLPEEEIHFPTIEEGVPGIYKKTIDFAHKLSQNAYYQFDNYIYPDFDVLLKDKRKDINRLTDIVKSQICYLVSFIINQYNVLRQIKHHHDSENKLDYDILLVCIVNLLYRKDSNFNRKNLYYNTQFYLHTIDDIFIEKNIQKARNDYKECKANNTGVYQPHGLRDEEELILSYIDSIVLREFFMNHFKSQDEAMNYFNFVPGLVEDLYQKIINKPVINKNIIDLEDHDVPF